MGFERPLATGEYDNAPVGNFAWGGIPVKSGFGGAMNQQVNSGVEVFWFGEMTFVQRNDGIRAAGALGFQRIERR